MKSKHLLLTFLLIVGELLFSFQLTTMAQEYSMAPVETCQHGKGVDCDLQTTDSRDNVPILRIAERGIAPEERRKIISHLKSLPIPFISNQGQMDKDVRFYTKTFGGTFFVMDTGALIYSLNSLNSLNSLSSLVGGKGRGRRPENAFSLTIKEELIGAKISGVKGEREGVTRVSYFKGDNPARWKARIPTYELVSLGEVYKGINFDLKAYGNNVEKLFHINPGADPGDIRLKINGAKGVKVNEDGELEISTELGPVKFTKPVAYQEKALAGEVQGGGERQLIEVAYVVDGANYGFKVGEYDKTRPLIIDPLLASTFIGGSDWDEAYSLAIDTSGDVYVTGYTTYSDYPTTAGAYDASFNSSFNLEDVFVSRFSSDLSTLLSSTFIGGGNGEWANSLAIGASGNVYVAGETNSSDYPTTAGAYQTTVGLDCIFVSRLSSDLSTLLSSTFVGGSVDDYARSLDIDSAGNVYIAGYTESSDYPTTAGAYDTSHNGIGDAFVSRFSNNLSTLLSSTFIGGTGYDGASSLAIDTSGNVYIAGAGEYDYPITAGAYGASFSWEDCSGGISVSRLSSDLSTILSSTTICGGEAKSLAIDTSGNVYVTGRVYSSSSSNYPTTAGAYDISYNGGYLDVFVAMLDANLSPNSRLTGISTRAKVETGDNVSIGGFIIGSTGGGNKHVLIRARGPSMSGAPFNVPGTLTNPTLEIYSGSTKIAQNDDWQTTDALCGSPAVSCGNATHITNTGMDPCQPNPGETSSPPGCNQESALLVVLPPGPYTAIVRGTSGGTGVGLVEVLDTSTSSTTQLTGISTRVMVLTGDNVEIGGFIIGSGSGDKTVLIRARGPSMSGAPFNVPGTLTNPTLELYSGSTKIAQNDDWQTTDALCGSPAVSCGNTTHITNTGMDPCQPNPGETSSPPGCSQESALYVTLPPGPYTAIVRGAEGGHRRGFGRGV